LLAAHGIHAQSETTGRITGSVFDSQGAAIPHASVEALNPATGEKRAAITDETGNYALPSLTSGNYDVTISAPGFTSALTRNVAVIASESARVDASLRVANASAIVIVTEAPPLIRTDSSVISTTLDWVEVESLPLSTRNPTQLLAFIPGVSSSLVNNSSLGRNSPEVSVNGARVTQNGYEINGVDANDIKTHDFSTVAVPAPETIAEMRVQSSMSDAGVSGAGGAAVEIITKSGTNELHGALYEYVRNDALNANDPSLKAVGLARPELKRNVFGGALGGPIRKNRAFYFLSYQGTRDNNGATGQSLYRNVPLDPCLTNDRSAAGLIASCSTPDNPVTSVNSAALALLNFKLPNGQFLVPTPQFDGLVSGSAVSTFREQQFNTNFDYHPGTHDTLTAKFFFANAPLFSALGWSNYGASPSFPGFGTHLNNDNRVLSVQYNHFFSSGAVNEARFGYNFIHHVEVPDEPIKDSDLNITRINAGQFPGLPLICLNRNGCATAIGSNEITVRDYTPSTSFIDSISLQRGRHNLRLGGEILHSSWHIPSANVFGYGEIDFDSFQEFLTGASDLSFIGTGQTVADWITTDYHLFVQDDWKATPKLTINLGLRYELNLPPYETEGRIGGFDPALYKPRLEVDANGFPVGPPAEGIIEAGNAPQRDDIPGVTRVSKRILKSDDPLEFGPRVGVAWSPLGSGKMSLRAGYGIFYSRPTFFSLAFNYFAPPFYEQSLFTGESIENPFPGAPPSSSFPLIQTGITLSQLVLDRNNRNPYFQQFNGSVQYEVAHDTVLQIAYVGSRGLRLYLLVATNQSRIASLDHPIFNPVTGQSITDNTPDNAALRAPLQGVDPGGFALNQSTGQSSYHSLQATLSRRMSRGVELEASYTFSKSIDDTPDAGGGAVPGEGTTDTGNALDAGNFFGNQLDSRANRGLSDFDRTHRFVGSFVWSLPNAAGHSGVARHAFSNWQLSGIVVAMSGLPIDLIDFAGGSLYGQFGARPNWAPGATVAAAKKNIPQGYYFNPFAFAEAVVPPGAPIPSAHDPTALAGDEAGTDFGNVGRNILRGPSQSDLDISLMKRFPIKESRNFEFRTDFFNALNHVSKSNPVSDISTANLDPITGRVLDPGNFGRILNTNSSPRIIQLSLKFNF